MHACAASFVVSSAQIFLTRGLCTCTANQTFEPTADVFKLEVAAGGVPSAAGWTQATALPGVRAQIAGAASNGSVFAVGGLGAGLSGTAVDVLA